MSTRCPGLSCCSATFATCSMGSLVTVDRISSAHLIDKLVVIVPRPWGEYGKAGKPITQNKLARLLQAATHLGAGHPDRRRDASRVLPETVRGGLGAFPFA